MLGKYQMFGMVRDKDGMPKIDNPADLHPVQLGMLTSQEREELGIWGGSWVRDAQGYKPVYVEDGAAVAKENLIAVSELFYLPADGSGAIVLAISPRCDVKTGATIPGVSAQGFSK